MTWSVEFLEEAKQDMEKLPDDGKNGICEKCKPSVHFLVNWGLLLLLGLFF